MNGFVDNAGRALVDLEVKADSDSPAINVTAWIDTGFTGDLVLPQTLIDDLGLRRTASVSAILADGSQTAMEVYECYIDWFRERRRLEVVANQGKHPLLGIGLLIDHELRINYATKEISLE